MEEVYEKLGDAFFRKIMLTVTEIGIKPSSAQSRVVSMCVAIVATQLILTKEGGDKNANN